VKGKLFVLGVGPGDPELMTVKSIRILNGVSCICVPKGREEGSSLALSIVRQVVDLTGKEVIEAYFPMRKTRESHSECDLDTRWHETVETVLGRLSRGIDTAFITIGDPAFYSTYFYLHERLLELDPSISIEIVPGISSINASAARAGLSLGIANESIAILPANYHRSLKKTLEEFDTVVLMKVHKVFAEIRETLDDMGLMDKAVYIVKAGMPEERIFSSLRDVREDDLNYFSIVVVRK
jgi:precorrin-2/cobalt-factor-2 C20-methyltransferase